MSIISLTVTDTDLAKGGFQVSLLIADHSMDDGKVTSAHFAGLFLHSQISTPKFAAALNEFSQRFIDGMVESVGELPATTEPATMVLTLTDTDLASGAYTKSLSGAGGDPTGFSLPTGAQLASFYMRSLLNDADFAMGVWAFAEETIERNPGMTFSNAEHRPVFLENHPSIHEAASVAA